MRVLHLNVRLNEGGAARVALDLHMRLLDKGIESQLFYGYGPGAKRNPYDKVVPNARYLGYRPQVVANYFIHKLVGVDVLHPVGRRASSLKTAIQESDIVHLHVIHSHFVSYAWLFRLLSEMNKKVVWTLHDSWAFTGRCAITGSSDKWLTGCGNCPFMENYPSARIDLSGFESKRKRKEIHSIGENLALVGCSRWITQRAELIFPEREIHFIPNGLDREMETYLNAASEASEGAKKLANLLVIGADLSDPLKQDITLIQRVIDSGQCIVHAVGKHSPFKGPNVVNHGPVYDRSRLTEIYRASDATLFTSEIDNFSLVIVESLASGTPILALDSAGSREVLNLMVARPVRNRDEILSRVRRRSFFDLYQQQTRDGLRNRAMEVFSGDKMADQYLQVYADMLNYAGV